NKAQIVFDVNQPIDTPEWRNTIDNTPPTSRMVPLPGTQTAPSFTINWTGSDVGAGVASYTVFVSRNDGPFVPFLTDTPETSATFTGQHGSIYSFFSRARDGVGNIEDKLLAADTTTLVVPLDTTPPTTSATQLPTANGNG